jgi:DNA-binding transcriptional regulator YiaG
MEYQEIIYEGLGFPIIIVNPQFIEFEGEKVLDVDHEELQSYVFRALIDKPARLTGAEVKFMRLYMEFTQEALAQKLILSNTSTISKWESKEAEFTGMDRQTEILLRMRCKLFLNARDKIAGSFIDNLAAKALSGEEVGSPVRFSNAS